MTYVNGNDFPEHLLKVLNQVINGEMASITSSDGQAVIISKEAYELLSMQARGDDVSPSFYRGFNLDRELEGFMREEIDY